MLRLLRFLFELYNRWIRQAGYGMMAATMQMEGYTDFEILEELGPPPT